MCVFQCDLSKFIQAVVELRLSVTVVWQDVAINTTSLKTNGLKDYVNVSELHNQEYKHRHEHVAA